MSDATNDETRGGIESLEKQFRRFCDTQPNEGNRLSMAKTMFDQATYWLRVNADVHEERLLNDRRLGTEAING